tara:strand:- start:1572 stop:2321 length:750 start_codon:yes stop_codon:yes gene_type:complete
MTAPESHILALEAEELGVSYGNTVVLRGITLRVEQGAIAVIVGPSGCGKSTLLKTAIGLKEASTGTIRVLGTDLCSVEEEDQNTIKRRIGVMFQYGALLNSLTVGENVALPLEMHTNLESALIRDIVRTRLHLVGIDATIDMHPAELSGGMRKRAALARAMVLDPDILFCDEPGAGLDPVTASEIDRLLLTVNQSLGIAVVIVTHELLSIERLGGQLLMLSEGELLFSGPTNEALNSARPDLFRFFHPK